MAGSLFNKFKGDRVRVLLGEGHMARQFTRPNRPRNFAWFKEKMLLTTIPHNVAFQTDDLDAYDSDCDDISYAKAVLMANLSSYSSDVLSEVPHSVTYQNDMINQSVQEMQYFEQTPIVDYPDNEITSDSNIISYSQYLQETQHAVVQDTTSSTQQDSMIISMIEKIFDRVVKVRTTPDAITEGSWGFEHTKKIELNEVKTVINQIEAAVEQCSIDKKYFDIQKKEIFLDNDRLLEHIICHDVMNIVMHADSVPVNVLLADNKCRMHDNLEVELLEQENNHLFELLLSQDIFHICVNSFPTRNNCHDMQLRFIHEYNENLVLKAELTKKEHMVEKKVFDEVLLRCSRLENRSANLELKLQHQKESFLNNRPLTKKYALEIQEFFHINEWQAKLDAKHVSIAKLKKHIENLKGKMWDAHIYYIKHSRKHADTLQEIVEHAKAPRPLASDLDSVCNSTSASRSQPSGNTRKNRISRTTSSNMKNKVKDHPMSVKYSSNKMNRVVEHVCNANVKHSMLNANSELTCATCNECMFDAIHDLYVLDFVNDVNVRSKSKSAKRSKKKTIWKPTSKVFTEIRYKWKHTRRTFNVARNMFPLTRITSTKVVHLKETTSNSVIAQNPKIKVYSRRPKVTKIIGSSSKSKIIEGRISNNSEPNQYWGSSASNVPSYSLVDFRLSKLFSGIWTLDAPSI
ncbi:hypothetical protein Tco_0414871 [Tanacetum coccineum]